MRQTTEEGIASLELAHSAHCFTQGFGSQLWRACHGCTRPDHHCQPHYRLLLRRHPEGLRIPVTMLLTAPKTKSPSQVSAAPGCFCRGGSPCTSGPDLEICPRCKLCLLCCNILRGLRACRMATNSPSRALSELPPLGAPMP